MRKILICLLVVMFAATGLLSAQSAGEMTVLDKAAAVERILYGAEQTGSLLERVTKLEKDMYGVETKDPLVTKLDRVYTYVRESSAAGPSFSLKLNAVEWLMSHNITNQPAKARIENLERIMVGSPVTGSFDSRLDKLMKMAYPGGQLEVGSVTVTKDSLVRIRIVSPLDTRSSRVGDIVTFQASDDVYIGGLLAIGKGAYGTGKVTKVEPAKNFGRDAKLEVSFDSIDSMDGNKIDTFLGEKAKEETKSLAKAAGATVAGMVLLGPIGVVGGAFVQGQDVSIPAGTELFIQTKNDVEVYGIKTK
jgi:hypothetical protein